LRAGRSLVGDRGTDSGRGRRSARATNNRGCLAQPLSNYTGGNICQCRRRHKRVGDGPCCGRSHCANRTLFRLRDRGCLSRLQSSARQSLGQGCERLRHVRLYLRGLGGRDAGRTLGKNGGAQPHRDCCSAQNERDSDNGCLRAQTTDFDHSLPPKTPALAVPGSEPQRNETTHYSCGLQPWASLLRQKAKMVNSRPARPPKARV
jgi:hypothetical protein